MHRLWTARGAGVLAPLAATAVIAPFRDGFADVDSTLVLVTVIVAISSLGDRLAGITAALIASISFDFFLTEPYHQFGISSRTDVETTVLLLVVGIMVTELAMWGRRQQARAAEQAGYLDGLHTACEVVASGGSPTQLADYVAGLLTGILDLQSCYFEFVGDDNLPRLDHDGQVSWGELRWNADQDGLPVTRHTQILVEAAGRAYGRFVLVPALDSRPTLTQRRVAVSLVDQVGAALGEFARSWE